MKKQQKRRRRRRAEWKVLCWFFPLAPSPFASNIHAGKSRSKIISSHPGKCSEMKVFPHTCEMAMAYGKIDKMNNFMVECMKWGADGGAANTLMHIRIKCTKCWKRWTAHRKWVDSSMVWFLLYFCTGTKKKNIKFRLHYKHCVLAVKTLAKNDWNLVHRVSTENGHRMLRAGVERLLFAWAWSVYAIVWVCVCLSLKSL